MTTENWPFLTALRDAIQREGPSRVPASTFSAIADRLEEALLSSRNQPLAAATSTLEAFCRDLLAHSSDGVRAAVRGSSAAPQDLAAALVLGQAAFAQTFAARMLDRRGDGRYLERLTDRRYEAYVRALLHGPLSGKDLQACVREAKETVSRKLAVLRQLGIVECRKEGTRVVNFLAPQARAFLEERNIAPLDRQVSTIQRQIREALNEKSKEVPGHLNRAPVLGAAA